MCIMICPLVTFERIVTQESIHYLLYSVCIFLLGILVQIVYSAPLFVRMPEMYLACWIMLRCHLWNMIGGVRYRVLCLTAQLVLAYFVLVLWLEEILMYFDLSPGGFTYGRNFFVLSLHTFCRAALSCFSNAASTDYVCNLVLYFLYSWSIFLFLEINILLCINVSSYGLDISYTMTRDL